LLHLTLTEYGNGVERPFRDIKVSGGRFSEVA